LGLKITLAGEQRSEEADRTGSSNERHLGLEPCAGADPHCVLPRFGHYGGGLQEYPEFAQRRVQTHGKPRVDAEPLTSIAVIAQNPAFNETTGLTHVPFVSRTGRAGQRVWTPHYSDDQVAREKVAVRWSFHHFAQRLVAQDKPVGSRRRDADTVDGDFCVGAADSDRAGPDQHRPVGRRRFRELDETGGLRTSGNDCDGFHWITFLNDPWCDARTALRGLMAAGLSVQLPG
jgi:hypothetical protein